MPTEPRLSKSRFVAGYQCPKLLWWKVHEKDAPELRIDEVLQDLFDQGHLVGEAARSAWPVGTLLDFEYRDPRRVPATREALDAGALVLFEASFEADGVFCAVDVLEKTAAGWTLIEVKSSSDVKDVHLPDLAIQAHVVRRSGLEVTRIEVMHLNKQHRWKSDIPLFTRTDVTADVTALLGDVPRHIEAQLAALAGPLPDVATGPHCWELRECAFWDRCWPTDRDHISRLYRAGNKGAWTWMQKGVHFLKDIPDDAKLKGRPARQVRAVREDRMIVEPGLKLALKPALDANRLGFLDFETVSRAIPVWPGLGPWHNAAAQFSYHERRGPGEYHHVDYLAEGPHDPREELAQRMLEATKGADRIVVYTSFEATQIKALREQLPQLADGLTALLEKLWDLNPVVSDFVYHPDFRGSYSLKTILTPLVPDLSYNDLVIVDGKMASVKIARLLFVAGKIPPAERERVRHDLLEYCKRDTFATVRLVERLAELA